MIQTEMQTLEGTPEQLTNLLKHLSHQKRYRIVEIEEKEATLPQPSAQTPREDTATLALLKSWIAEAPTDPEEIRIAEEELLEFKRNMNQPRKEGGMRLLYPEAETE